MFSEQFEKIATRNEKDRLQNRYFGRTACMVVNQAMVDNLASLFNCMTMGLSSY